MNDIINLACDDKIKIMKRSEIINFYFENKDFLREFVFDNCINVFLISNFSGWCTCVTEKNNIIQVWAGELRTS